ncbi:MAG: helix-turn-helix domain-containing protein [Vulcanococcus sp.]
MGHPTIKALMPRFALSIPWLRRRDQSPGDSDATSPSVDPLLEAGQRLREEREARGLNLRQMALETRISTPVLEALERGWRDRLPEGAYLKAMLPMIEQHLGMPEGSLSAALPEANPKKPVAVESSSGGLLQGFNPLSIDVFSSWQGSVLYGVITLGLIYGINLYPRILLQPVPPQPLQTASKPGAVGSITLLSVYPELKPLQQAKQGVGLKALGQRP